jgi:hypothetical protein
MVTVGEWSVVVISDGPIENEAHTTNADKCPDKDVFHMFLRVMIQIWDLVKVYIINDAHTKWTNCECSNVIVLDKIVIVKLLYWKNRRIMIFFSSRPKRNCLSAHTSKRKYRLEREFTQPNDPKHPKNVIY